MVAVSIKAVRRLAQRYRWIEIQLNETSRVISFMKYSADGDDIWRVNIYYTTGTVSTCLSHPKHPSRTQLFRKNQSLENIEAIFQNPRVHTNDGYYRRQSHQRPEPSCYFTEGNRYAVQYDAPRHPRGTGGICYSFDDYSLRKRFQRSFFGDDVVCTDLGEDGFITISVSGRFCSSNLPRPVHNLARGRQISKQPNVDFVALSCEDDYFAQTLDGKQIWQVDNSLFGEWIVEADGDIEFVALGPDGAFYILWEDGDQAFANLPRGLSNQLIGRQKSKPGVEDLAIGPNGQWFVRYLDGHVRGSFASDLHETIEDLQEEEKSIASVRFGGNGNWLVRWTLVD